MMQKLAIRIIGVGFGLAVAGGAHAQTRELGSSGELLDGVAALVDTGIVLKSELSNRVRVVADNFAAQQATLPPGERGQLPPLSILEEQVLDQLILEEIQIQRAQAIGIEVGDDILNAELARIAEGLGTTLEEFPSWLNAQDINYASFREDQRRDYMMRVLENNEVMQKIYINPRELEMCLNMTAMSETDESDYNVSHILIGFAPNASPEEVADAESRIRDIGRQLDEGADFTQLAVAYSESQTALEGGQLGWRKGSELPTMFVSDVSAMEVGEHSTPIRGGGGFHIVRLNEMRGSEPMLVDQIRPRHILMSETELLDEDATRQRILGIREQIVNGDDFAAVASAVSVDLGSAVEGGDLGWITVESLDDSFVPEFAATLKALEVGELSEPFLTEYGWHIAEVVDSRSYDISDDMRDANCRNQIGRAKSVEESELWRQRMRAQAYVVKKL